MAINTAYITAWARNWDASIAPEVHVQIEKAYAAWHASRTPINQTDGKKGLVHANNVVILPPTRDFKGRTVNKIFAEHKARGRLFGYSLDLSRPRFARMSPIELGTFIGTSGLKDYEDFGLRESLPNESFINGLYYDDFPFRDLVTRLRAAGVYMPWDGRDSDYASPDHRRRSDLLRDLHDHVRKLEKARIKRALDKFVHGLDRTAISIIIKHKLDGTNGASSDLTVRAYEWLCGCNEWHDSNTREKLKPVPASTGAALRNRRDVGHMWGGLLEYIMGADITKAIDSGQPRIPTLTPCFGHWSFPAYDFSSGNRTAKLTPASPEFVRWLKNRDWEEFHGTGKFQYNRIHSGFAVAAALPPQWRPRNAADWAVYDRSARTIKGIADLLGRDMAEVTLALAHVFNRKAGFPSRVLKKAATVQDTFAANFADHHNMGNLSDFLASVPAQVILPAIVQTARAGGFAVPAPDNISQWAEANPISAQSNYAYITGHLARAMFQGMTVSDLLKFANRWHLKLNRIQTRSMKLEGAYHWPPLFEGTITTKGGAVAMQCLSSTADLVYAGKKLHNCVGGYAFKCIFGNSHIIQLENTATMEQALLELHDIEIGEGRGEYRVEQLQIEAPSNQPAAPWAVAAASELVARINKNGGRGKASIVNLPALVDARHALRNSIGMDTLVLKAGFDPSDTAYADNAYHVLHHEMREMFPQGTRAEYLAAKGITRQIPSWLKQQREWNRPRV